MGHHLHRRRRNRDAVSSAGPAHVDSRSTALARTERRLQAWAAALASQSPWESRHCLAAEPVARLIVELLDGTGDAIDEVAASLGVDGDWAADVVAGTIVEIGLDHIQQLCEALHCSPVDLWGAEATRTILASYPPELWPRWIEPLMPADDEPPRAPVGIPAPTPPPSAGVRYDLVRIGADERVVVVAGNVTASMAEELLMAAIRDGGLADDFWLAPR